MKISPFQALVILAKEYKDSDEGSAKRNKFAQINHLFLLGVQTEEDRQQLDALLKDEALEGYEIALGDKETINNDPVRRYYESTLAHETLKETIDSLNIGKLRQHFQDVYHTLPMHLRLLIPITIYNGAVDGVASKTSTTASEYIAAIQKLHEPKNFLSLKPTGKSEKEQQKMLEKRMEKMMILVKIVHAAMSSVMNDNEKFPLNLYTTPNSPYEGKRRGRKDKKDEADNPQVVRSNNLGIMFSYHPLPQDDPLAEDLQAKTSGQYKRPADSSTYIEGAEIPEKFFANEVSPFVNSISGTMLCQLRVMAKLLKENKLQFQNDPEQLKAFFKTFISYMIYNSGGHSFQEFMSVFALEEVQNEFKDIPGFNELNLRELFQKQNPDAYHSAMQAAIQYNDKILAKRKLHEELVPEKDKQDLSTDETDIIEDKTSRREDEMGVIPDELTQLVRSRLHKPKDIESSGDRKNRLIDMAYNKFLTSPSDEKAINFLIAQLKIPVDETENREQQIHAAMRQRLTELRQRLFSNTRTLSQSVDEAWAIYQDQNKTSESRMLAQSFLIYALNIQPQEIVEGLNTSIYQLMNERELVKKVNPEYIPRMSPLPSLPETSKKELSRTRKSGPSDDDRVAKLFRSKDLLDVNPYSKRKDKGSRTRFYTPEERGEFRVLISNGILKREGNPVDIKSSISHGKKGFAAFTINVNGEISLFQHVDHKKTRVAHSSMNTGEPVFAAGELQIENGKLISITDHSGHYRPSLYNIFKVLEYFKNQGISIEETKILTFANPSKLPIISAKSKEFSQFYEINAEDLYNSYKGKLKAALKSVEEDLKQYQTPSFRTALYFIKDWFTNTQTTKMKMEKAKALSEQVHKLVNEINSLQTPEEIKSFCTRIETDLTSLTKKENIPEESNLASGRLEKKMKSFRSKLQELKKEDSQEKYEEQLKGTHRT